MGVMEFAQPEIMEAVMSTLVGESALTTLLSDNIRTGGKGVMEFVPENQPYDYVEIFSIESREFRTLSRPGEEAILTLKVHSDAEGGAQARAIQRQINLLLGDVDDIGIDSNEYTTVGSWFEFAAMLKEVDAARAIKFVLVSRFRLKVQQVAGF